MEKRNAVFVRFSHLEGGGQDYFVGSSLEAILTDTDGGQSFGGRDYRPGGHCVVSREEIEKIDPEGLAEGIVWVEERGVDSFLLG